MKNTARTARRERSGNRRLRVLLAFLGLLVLVLVLDRTGVIGGRNTSSQAALSAADAKDAQAQLALASAPSSFVSSAPCLSATAVCFTSKRPLAPMSSRAAVQLIKSFGLPLRDIVTFNCSGLPPTYRATHLMSAAYGCGGVASLGRFVAAFSVTSMNSDCRALQRGVGTQVEIAAVRVGHFDPKAVAQSPAVRELQALNSATADTYRQVIAKNHLHPKTDWPQACRG